GPAAQILDRTDVREFAFTNSIPLSPEVKTDRVRILSAAPLLARAMRNIHLNESVSTLFT
ncbi:MAG: ribose-phosphate pyrophosphokinase, partial [Acidobacteria bacterium]